MAHFCFSSSSSMPSVARRIIVSKTVIRVDRSEHSEDAGLLHSIEFLPKIFLGDRVRQTKLRLQFIRQTQQRQLHVRSSESMRGQRV